MTYIDRKARLLAYLREHPEGATAGQVMTYARLGKDGTAAVIRSILDELTVEGRVALRIEARPCVHGSGYLREFRLYHAVEKAI